jgi:DNA-binding transcriptional LysR family regulator
VRLLERTTRTLHLTDEGARFYEQVAAHLDGIEQAAIVASGVSTAVKGTLRVNVDPFLSRLVLAPHLHFIERYPELEIELADVPGRFVVLETPQPEGHGRALAERKKAFATAILAPSASPPSTRRS